jgi:antitoxin component YwqK of YwqJK toxin-antitoxin module
MRSKLLMLVICLILVMGCEENEREDFFDLHGNQITQFEFKLRRETGTIVVYYENGNKKASATLIDGDLKKILEWYESGNLKSESVYENDGTYKKNEKKWYENGKLESEKSYKNDKMHGKIREWYKNGQKKSECDYIEGKLHGKWIFWNEYGKLESIMEFKDDHIIKETIFKDGKKIDVTRH